jgi:2'-5' RNA ligase
MESREGEMGCNRAENRFSLWLMPAGRVYRQLAGRIRELSREHSTPEFEPHVTLLGRILRPEGEVITKSASLAKLIRPFVVRLTSVDGLDEYFRCLFVRVAETAPVMKANQVAREVFNLREQPAYMPHLSLMYGNLTSDAKEGIVSQLGHRFDVAFKVRSLHVFSTTGQPNEWRRVKAFDLK